MKGETVNVIEEMRRLLPKRALDAREAQLVAEYQALRLLELLGSTGPPVNVGLITELPEIDVHVRPKLAASGFAGKHGDRWIIAIREEDHLYRKRFSLARFFKSIIDDEARATLYPASRSSTAKDQAEQARDAFAAGLLMPRAWVHDAWSQEGRSVSQLAALFCVSRVAMGRRLKDLGLIGQAQLQPDSTVSVQGHFEPAKR
jgi:hypothetical protein